MAETKEQKSNGKLIADEVVRGGFRVALSISGRQFEMSGYISDKDTKETLNARIDEAQDIIDRQLIRAEINSLQGQIKAHNHNLKVAGKKMDEILQRRREGKTLTSQQNVELRNLDVTLEGAKEGIVHCEEQIAASKAAIGLA